MNTQKISELMKTLYGPTATQMMGGADYEVVAYPEYIKNEDFKKYMTEFYLIKKICSSKNATVYVIPPTKELDKMIKDFKAELSKNGKEERSVEAFQYAVNNDLPYKRCIFSMFADSDVGSYKLDKSTDMVTYKKFGRVKRTNLLCEQYWFEYKTPTEILICPNKNDNKDATTVKLIAKCTTNGIFVFQGSLPNPKEKYTKKISKKSFLGGARMRKLPKVKRINKFTCLKKLINRYGEVEGSERFIASIYKANENNAELSKCFSGDLLHTAFRLTFNDEVDDKFVKVNKSEMRNITKQLISEFKIVDRKLDMAKFTDTFKKCYINTLINFDTPEQSTKNYINNILKVYNKCGKDMIYADIATNMYRGNMFDNFQNIYDIVDDFDQAVNDNTSTDTSTALHLEFSNTSTDTYRTSKLCSYINNALMFAPLVGINAKSYYPQLQSIKSTEKMNLYGGYFENVYGLDIEDEEDEDAVISEEEEQQPELETKNDSDVEEIKEEINVEDYV